MPKKIELEHVEDFYTYYVHILKISEEIFWYENIGFVRTIVNDINAYDSWYNTELERMEGR